MEAGEKTTGRQGSHTEERAEKSPGRLSSTDGVFQRLGVKDFLPTEILGDASRWPHQSPISPPPVSASFLSPEGLLTANHSCHPPAVSDTLGSSASQSLPWVLWKLRVVIKRGVENEEGVSIPISAGFSPALTSIPFCLLESGTLWPLRPTPPSLCFFFLFFCSVLFCFCILFIGVRPVNI